MRALDATRTEAMGPPLAALLVQRFSPCCITMIGDNAYVVGALEKRFLVRDVHIFNCIEVAFDVLCSCPFRAVWQDRSHNVTCDSLARLAVT